MKTYKCDACGKIIDNPHKLLMKEFYVGYSMIFDTIPIPENSKRLSRIDLCDDCFKGLSTIAKKNRKENNEN